MSIIESLRQQIRQHETTHAITHEVLPFNIAEIDTRLPEKGLKLGAFHEVAGEAAAALFIAGILARTEGPVLWCIKQQDLFAPALEQAGLDISRIIFVEAGNEQNLLACFEEGLRHKGMAGVIGEVSKLSMTASRRLQLAAETSGALGIALWRWRKENHPTAAYTSWKVSPLCSPALPVQGIGRARWKLELLRCRGAEPAEFIVEACNEKGYLAIPSAPVYRSAQKEPGLSIAS